MSSPGDDPDAPSPRRGRRLLRSLVGSVVVIAAVLIVAPSLGRSTGDLGPGSVEIAFRPAFDGKTVLALPPIGEAGAATHDGPVELRLELRSIDVNRLVGRDGRIDVDAVRSSVDDDLGSAMRAAVIRLVMVGALVGAVAAAALPWRSRSMVASGAVGGAMIAGLLAGSALPGFDARRFEDLTYEGPITAGRQVVESLSATGGPVGDRVGALADRLAALYSATLTSDIRDSAGEVVILHISDLHLNPIGAQLARSLATGFDVDAVLDTGDTTSFGTEFEGAYAELLADFPVPYLFVAGNHDSRPNRAAISSTPGVIALHDRSIDIGGVRIAGFDDPLITTTEDVPRSERERVELAATPDLVALIERERPDVLAVHNPVILQGVVGTVDLAVAGHRHEAALGARDGTLISLVGSTGATGLGSLLVDSDLPASASLLRFRNGRLVAVDELTIVGVGGDLVIRRHTITDADRSGDTADFIGRDVDEARSPAGGPESTTTTPGRTTSRGPGE